MVSTEMSSEIVEMEELSTVLGGSDVDEESTVEFKEALKSVLRHTRLSKRFAAVTSR